jgi:hypothetical protein
MAVDQKLDASEESRQGVEHAGRNSAVKAVAAAAATGAAAFAAKKALSGRSGANGGSGDSQGTSKGEGSVVGSMVSGGWEAARDALIPAAENAASAVGAYLAENGPDVIRERIVPRFISSFENAREGT